MQVFEIKTQCLEKKDIPSVFLNTERPPKRLFIQGNDEAFDLIKKLPENGLAIVGTRNPTLKSREFLKRSISGLRDLPFIIVSGFARGMDRVAHETAVQVGLKTIAVLGAGLEVQYPKEHFDLRNLILNSGGLLVSEWEPTQPPLAHQFLLRNRLIAALARATLVAEAAKGSGAMNTASWARKAGRDLYAVPGFPTEIQYSGCSFMIEEMQAIPFYGNHSLGHTWTSLTSEFFYKRTGATTQRNPSVYYIEGADSSKTHQIDENFTQLISFLRNQTLLQGGCDPVVVLEWALSMGFTAQMYFDWVERGTQLRLIEAQDQILRTVG